MILLSFVLLFLLSLLFSIVDSIVSPPSTLNWGSDQRVLSGLAKWVQSHLSMTALPSTEPPSLTLALFPFLLVVNIPVPWLPAKHYLMGSVVDITGHVIHPVLHLHVGWRRDMSVGIYYPSAELKVMDRTKLW